MGRRSRPLFAQPEPRPPCSVGWLPDGTVRTSDPRGHSAWHYESGTGEPAEHPYIISSGILGTLVLRRSLASEPSERHVLRRVIVCEMPRPLDWETLLVKGYEPLKLSQRVFRLLPHDPRCKLCQNPFGGLGGKVIGIVGRKPSRKNPNVCQYCFDHLPPGGIEIDIGVVFADVRSSTALGERSKATDFAERLNAFYAAATKVLIQHDGIVDKLIGDAVMGLFIQGIAGQDYRRKAALAALELASKKTDLALGVAANAGIAFVGNVGSGTVLDFTALGDAVNVGARLQAHAGPGEVVLSAPLYSLIEEQHPGGRPDRLTIRGREEPVDVVVLTTT